MITVTNVVAVGTALAVTPVPLHREARPDLGVSGPAILLDDVPNERVRPLTPSIRLSSANSGSTLSGCRAEIDVPSSACRDEAVERGGSIRVSVTLMPR